MVKNIYLNKEQYKFMEQAIATETPVKGYKKNANIIAMLIEKYPLLKDVPKLTTKISARRAYVKAREAGRFDNPAKSWQKPSSEVTSMNTVSWLSNASAVKEETVSAVRPSMKREAFTPPNNIEAPVSHQEYVTTHTTKKPISPNINDWTVETVVITSNMGVINISLHHPSLNTREMSKILKSILPKQR